MEKYQHMKAFISSAAEYCRMRSEKTSSTLHRHLQILAITENPSIFDPDSSVAVEFFISLHELMSGLESKSSLMWAGITVLEQACKNSSARAALIHTFKFAPILTRLLGAHLTNEKRIRILHLLQELTYGVKISWQEAHLPFLISTLTQWIMGSDKSVIGLSLAVLVNLCYKNLPAVYTLMRTVDSKQFLRIILNLQNENVNTQVQVCKLLIILEHISGDIPASDVLSLLKATFSTLTEAFKTRDIFLLRHIVDFFSDVCSNTHSCEVLNSYKSFREDTESLLLLLDESSDPECVGMLFEFLQQLVTVRHSPLVPLFPRLVNISETWIQREAACTATLCLLRTIMLSLRQDNSSSDVMLTIASQLSDLLPVLIHVLESGKGEESDQISMENRARLTALMQLMKEMCKINALCERMAADVKQTTMQKVFQTVISADTKTNNNFFHKEIVALHVHALTFISVLSTREPSWLKMFIELLSHQQVQTVMAMGLYTGDGAIKREVLALTGTQGFPAESFSSLAKSLCELEPLVVQPSHSKGAVCNTTNGNLSQHDLTPLFNIAQEGRLDDFIDKLRHLLHTNEVKDIPMSSVMELYEYKLAALGHSERALHSSLEAANNHATHLQHRVAQMNAESSRLHQLVYQSQQHIELLQEEKKDLMRRIELEKTTAEESHNKHVQELRTRQKTIAEQSSSIDELKRNLSATLEEKDNLETKIDALQEQLVTVTSQADCLADKIRLYERKDKENNVKITDLNAKCTKYEEKIRKNEKLLQDRDVEIATLKKGISTLRAEVANLDLLCKSQEKTMEEKEQEINKLQSELSELQRIREVIYEISAGKKKMDK